ncbi:hypothetical protein [Amycolatopsis sp. MJM2582]|uniref:hypothetical protein n=1 Tax=Amycolatopsis sp. MJM2582 TaxID=1427749 RepID=UPI000566FCE5|nr:hypothetical protein [Amycolatopsis sp. MJM2582]
MKVPAASGIEHMFRIRGWSRRHPRRMWLNPGHGTALLDAAGNAELVWATTWGHQAKSPATPGRALSSG